MANTPIYTSVVDLKPSHHSLLIFSIRTKRFRSQLRYEAQFLTAENGWNTVESSTMCPKPTQLDLQPPNLTLRDATLTRTLFRKHLLSPFFDFIDIWLTGASHNSDRSDKSAVFLLARFIGIDRYCKRSESERHDDLVPISLTLVNKVRKLVQPHRGTILPQFDNVPYLRRFRVNGRIYITSCVCLLMQINNMYR